MTEQIAANNQILYLILSVAGAIIVLLLGVIAYFARGVIRSHNGVSEAVRRLELWLTGQEKDVSNLQRTCLAITEETKDHLEQHDKHLERHDVAITKHGEDIATIKERIRNGKA